VIRVLIVEDDFRVAEINAAYVSKEPDFEVIGIAHSAAVGLQMVLELKPELVLLDLFLPDDHGLELFSKLQQLPRGSKPDVFVITAAKDSQSLKDAIQLGAASYIVKPFNGHELIERLRTYKGALERLHQSSEVSQAEVDATVAMMRGAKATEPSDASSSNPTTSLILNCLQENSGPMSASEVSSVLRISRATAQRYLSQMADRKLVVLELQYGAAGRPINKYRLIK
jgi:response regulator of citrate/malate metabolism